MTLGTSFSLHHFGPRFDPFGPVSVLSPEFFHSPDSSEGPSFRLPFLPRRATQEELQRRPSPAAETPPLQRRPSVRAAIRAAESAASRGRPQTEPIPEAEAARRPGRAETPGGADPASPDLGPRGPDLAGLQAERDVVSGRGQPPGGGARLGAGPLGVSPQSGGGARSPGVVGRLRVGPAGPARGQGQRQKVWPGPGVSERSWLRGFDPSDESPGLGGLTRPPALSPRTY